MSRVHGCTDEAGAARPPETGASARPVRLALVGLDSSHADQTVRLLVRGRLGPGVTLAALGVPVSRWAGRLPPGRADALVRLHGEGADPAVLTGDPVSLADALAGRVDAVVVADRDARAHAEHAAPFLRAGVPVLVDKPFVLDVREATGLVRLAEGSGAVLTSFSPLRWHADVRAVADLVDRAPGAAAVVASGPVVAGSAHGGLAFYAVHAVEAALAVARGAVVDVRRVDKDGVVVLSVSTERDVATVVLAEPVGGRQAPFAVSAVVGDGLLAREVELGPEYLLPGLEVFCAAVRSGAAPLGARQMVDVVRVLEALR